MLREIFLIASISTTMLCAMGGPVPNYDEKFNDNINERIKENMARTTPYIGEVVEVEQPSNNLSNIRLKSLVFQEIKGKNIPVKEVTRGSKVVYINLLKNDSSNIKRDIILKNPIPKGTEYVRGSAICNNGCTISYSSSSGDTLSSSEDGIINYIEYYFKSMNVGKEYRMGFRAVVK